MKKKFNSSIKKLNKLKIKSFTNQNPTINNNIKTNLNNKNNSKNYNKSKDNNLMILKSKYMLNHKHKNKYK